MYLSNVHRVPHPVFWNIQQRQNTFFDMCVCLLKGATLSYIHNVESPIIFIAKTKIVQSGIVHWTIQHCFFFAPKYRQFYLMWLCVRISTYYIQRDKLYEKNKTEDKLVRQDFFILGNGRGCNLFQGKRIRCWFVISLINLITHS